MNRRNFLISLLSVLIIGIALHRVSAMLTLHGTNQYRCGKDCGGDDDCIKWQKSNCGKSTTVVPPPPRKPTSGSLTLTVSPAKEGISLTLLNASGNSVNKSCITGANGGCVIGELAFSKYYKVQVANDKFKAEDKVISFLRVASSETIDVSLKPVTLIVTSEPGVKIKISQIEGGIEHTVEERDMPGERKAQFSLQVPEAGRSYKITASKAGFQTLPKDADLSPGETKQIDFVALTKLAGSIQVFLDNSCNDPDIEFLLDGQPKVSTACENGYRRIQDIAEGSYKFEVKQRGNVLYQKAVSVNSLTPIEVRPSLEAALEINGMPDVEVSLNGDSKGAIPASGRLVLTGLKPQTYEIRGTKRGYDQDKTDPVQLRAGNSNPPVVLKMSRKLTDGTPEEDWSVGASLTSDWDAPSSWSISNAPPGGRGVLVKSSEIGLWKKAYVDDFDMLVRVRVDRRTPSSIFWVLRASEDKKNYILFELDLTKAPGILKATVVQGGGFSPPEKPQQCFYSETQSMIDESGLIKFNVIARGSTIAFDFYGYQKLVTSGSQPVVTEMDGFICSKSFNDLPITRGVIGFTGGPASKEFKVEYVSVTRK